MEVKLEIGTQSQESQPAKCLLHTKIPTRLFMSSQDVDQYVASIVVELIRENNSAGLPTVLGLPTGSTPIGVYRELIRQYDEEDLDFSKVITFNLDEYWPMSPKSDHSYRRWMNESFFDHVNILDDNIHIPRGELSRDAVEIFCEEYEREI